MRMSKKIVTAGLVLCGVLSGQAKELNLYIWSEYIAPDVVADFEREFDCKVNMSHYLNNEEMQAKLVAGGVSQYDVIVPSDYIIPSLIGMNLLMPLDHSKIPNIENLNTLTKDPAFDKGNVYTVGWQWGTVGLIYNKSKFDGPVDSWKSIMESDKSTKFMCFDTLRETVGAAAKYLGYSMNTVDPKELREIADLLIKAKKSPGFRGFEGCVGARNKVISGVIDIAMAYNGDAMRVLESNDQYAFCTPKEGSVIWLDSLCIPAKAPNAELAMEFLNFTLRPDIGARISGYAKYATPNKKSFELLSEKDRSNPVIYPPEIIPLEYISDLGKNTKIYDELWKMVKTR